MLPMYVVYVCIKAHKRSIYLSIYAKNEKLANLLHTHTLFALFGRVYKLYNVYPSLFVLPSLNSEAQIRDASGLGLN